MPRRPMVSCGHVTSPNLFDQVNLRNLRPEMTQRKAIAKDIHEYASIHIGYSPPLTNLAAQTEFSQPQKDCSGSSKDAHGL